jgi:hypothetical protein
MDRFDSFLNTNLQSYTDYIQLGILDEIIICDENGNDYDKISTAYNRFIESGQIKLYKNDAILGVFKNKLKVCSLATYDYIALIDSDNFCDINYFITAKKYILKNSTILSNCFILAPSFAKPNFNYTYFNNAIVTKNNINNYYSVANFGVLLNTGNYVLHKSIINNIKYDDSIMFKISACDVLYFNLLAFQQFDNFQLHVLQDLHYSHVVHSGSTFTTTIHNCAEYRDNVIVPGYYSLYM